MNFPEAEQIYLNLKNQLLSGVISQQEFRNRVNESAGPGRERGMVADPRRRRWMAPVDRHGLGRRDAALSAARATSVHAATCTTHVSSGHAACSTILPSGAAAAVISPAGTGIRCSCTPAGTCL